MTMLSDDDLNLRGLSEAELARAWDLWFDLAQNSNDADPAYSHGVFQLARPEAPRDRARVDCRESGARTRDR